MARSASCDKVPGFVGAAAIMLDTVMHHKRAAVVVTALNAGISVPLQHSLPHCTPLSVAQVSSRRACPPVVARTAQFSDVLGGLRFASESSADRCTMLRGNLLSRTCCTDALAGLVSPREPGQLLALPVCPRSALVPGRLPTVRLARIRAGFVRHRNAPVPSDLPRLERSNVRCWLSHSQGVARPAPAEPVHVAPAAAIVRPITVVNRASLHNPKVRMTTDSSSDQVGGTVAGADLTVTVRLPKTS